MMEFKANIPFFKHGLSLERVSFAAGRLAVDMARHGGLTRIVYFGSQGIGAGTLFTVSDPISAFAKLFRVYLLVDEEVHYLEFNQTRTYPFGYRSESALPGIRLVHEMVLLPDALCFRIIVHQNKDRRTLRLRMAISDDMVPVQRPGRTWSKYKIDTARNCVSVHVDDQDARQTSRTAATRNHIALSGTGKLALSQTTSTKRTHLDANIQGDRAALFVLFAGQEKGFQKRLRQLQTSVHHEMDGTWQGFEAARRERSKITVADATVQSFLALAPAMMDSIKVADIPGGVRAADSGYWIWGWDSMVNADAMVAWNDLAGVRDMLEFFRRTADAKLGIAHAFTTDCKPAMAMAPAAQCLYIIMLFDYYLFTRDRAVLQEYYPFACAVLERAIREEVRDTGMLRGMALYPDHPKDMGHDGHDISVLNNSIFYQAAKAMAWLAHELDDTTRATDAQGRAARLLASFRRYLYDHRQGYFYDSISSRDYAPRKHYPAHALFWVTPYARDLVQHDAAAIGRFMRKNLTARHGVSMLPRWDTAFMKDGNQIGSYMPAVERFYWQMMKLTGQHAHTRHWFDTVEWCWGQHTVPEAMACEALNEVTLDNPGRKQGYGIRGWYSIFFNVMAGIDLGPAGLRIAPMDGPEIRLTDLHIAGRKISIHLRGRGGRVGSLRLNGKAIQGNRLISVDQLEKSNHIVVTRSKEK